MNKQGYFKERIQHLGRLMEAKNLDVVIVVKPEHVMYYSGFNPIINSHPVFFIMTKEVNSFLLVPALRQAHAEKEAAIDEIKAYGMWGRVDSLGSNPFEVLRQLFPSSNLRIGIEATYITVEFYKQIETVFKGCSLVSISDVIEQQKLIKDDYEIGLIRKASELVDCGTSTIIKELQLGRSEMEACTEAQYEMRMLWQRCYSEHETCGYGTADGGMIDSLFAWCLSNERIAYGCDTAKHYYVQSGDLTLPMTWAKLDGYHAENERTLLVGTVSILQENAYRSMLEARQAVFKVLSPNVSCGELYEEAATCFTTAGFGHILPGRIGHGIGASAHERLSINRGNKQKLKPGMVISIEPGLMDPDWGGVRHSDTVLITETGYEVLTKLPAGELRI